MSTGRPQAQLPPISREEAEIAIASKPRADMSDAEALRQYQQLKAQLTRDGQIGPNYRGPMK